MRQLKRPFYQPAIYVICRFACWLVFKLIWRLRINGQENIPSTGAFIIAANHRSLSDPPLVGVSCPRTVHFMAKEELFSFKPFGWLIRHLNAHPLKRGGGDVGAFKTAITLLRQGEGLIVFPEGRRSKTDQMGKPKAGVALLSNAASAPVIPAYVHNSGYLSSLKPLSVSFGPPVRPENFPENQEMADRVMLEIAHLRDNLQI